MSNNIINIFEAPEGLKLEFKRSRKYLKNYTSEHYLEMIK